MCQMTSRCSSCAELRHTQLVLRFLPRLWRAKSGNERKYEHARKTNVNKMLKRPNFGAAPRPRRRVIGNESGSLKNIAALTAPIDYVFNNWRFRGGFLFFWVGGRAVETPQEDEISSGRVRFLKVVL